MHSLILVVGDSPDELTFTDDEVFEMFSDRIDYVIDIDGSDFRSEDLSKCMEPFEKKEDSAYMITEEEKKEFFREAFDMLRKTIGETSLETFVSDFYTNYKLRALVEGSCFDGRLVFYLGSSYTFADFIRMARQGSEYYLNQIFDYHI